MMQPCQMRVDDHARLVHGEISERYCALQPAQTAMIQHLAEGTFDIEQGLVPQSDSGEDGALSVLPLLLLVALVSLVHCAPLS